MLSHLASILTSIQAVAFLSCLAVLLSHLTYDDVFSVAVLVGLVVFFGLLGFGIEWLKIRCQAEPDKKSYSVNRTKGPHDLPRHEAISLSETAAKSALPRTTAKQNKVPATGQTCKSTRAVRDANTVRIEHQHKAKPSPASPALQADRIQTWIQHVDRARSSPSASFSSVYKRADGDVPIKNRRMSSDVDRCIRLEACSSNKSNRDKYKPDDRCSCCICQRRCVDIHKNSTQPAEKQNKPDKACQPLHTEGAKQNENEQKPAPTKNQKEAQERTGSDTSKRAAKENQTTQQQCIAKEILKTDDAAKKASANAETKGIAKNNAPKAVKEGEAGAKDNKANAESEQTKQDSKALAGKEGNTSPSTTQEKKGKEDSGPTQQKEKPKPDLPKNDEAKKAVAAEPKSNNPANVGQKSEEKTKTLEAKETLDNQSNSKDKNKDKSRDGDGDAAKGTAKEANSGTSGAKAGGDAVGDISSKLVNGFQKWRIEQGLGLGEMKGIEGIKIDPVDQSQATNTTVGDGQVQGHPAKQGKEKDTKKQTGEVSTAQDKEPAQESDPKKTQSGNVVSTQEAKAQKEQSAKSKGKAKQAPTDQRLLELAAKLSER